MKIVLAISALGLLSMPAVANDALKIKTIKELYDSSVFYNVEDEIYDADPKVIYNYADDALAQALILQDAVLEKEGMVCGEFLGAVMWDTNDADFETKINYSVNRDGRVKVEFGYGGTAQYALSCGKTSCKITDIYINDTPPISLKSAINKNCR